MEEYANGERIKLHHGKFIFKTLHWSLIHALITPTVRHLVRPQNPRETPMPVLFSKED